MIESGESDRNMESWINQHLKSVYKARYFFYFILRWLDT